MRVYIKSNTIVTGEPKTFDCNSNLSNVIDKNLKNETQMIIKHKESLVEQKI